MVQQDVLQPALHVDNDQVRRSLDALRETARGTGNTMHPLMDCVRAYATVGEMCDALREDADVIDMSILSARTCTRARGLWRC